MNPARGLLILLLYRVCMGNFNRFMLQSLYSFAECYTFFTNFDKRLTKILRDFDKSLDSLF